MEKFRGKLSKDDLKRFAKEVQPLSQIARISKTNVRMIKISKKLVNSDYKNQRVDDPTRVSSRQEKQVKKYVQEYFEKAVAKKKEHDKKKAERKGNADEGGFSEGTPPKPCVKEAESDDEQDMAMSEEEDEKPKRESATPVTPMDQLLISEGLKRKRGIDSNPSFTEKGDEEATPSKRLKSESPPPPPPPPPVNEVEMDTLVDPSERSDTSGSLQILTGSYDGPKVNDTIMENSLDHTSRPPPPRPPMKPGNLNVLDPGNESVDEATDIAGNSRVLDRGDAPNMEIRNDEVTIDGHERHYPAHGHRPALPIPGEA